MQIIHKIYFLSFFLLFLLNACNSDFNSSELKGDKDLAAYLEDYQVPRLKWGYINRQGNEIIKAIFDDNRDFSEGLASVNKKGLWGYINPSGLEVISPQYRAAYNFSEGVAIVQTFNKEYHIIDKTGSVLYSLECDEIGQRKNRFHKIKKGAYYFFVNSTGTELTDQKFDYASDFKDAAAIVQISNKYGVIDTNGVLIVPIVYDYIKRISSNLYSVKVGINYGVVDNANNNLIEPTLIRISDAQEGIVAMKNSDFHYLYDINKKKKISSDYTYLAFGGDDIWHYGIKGKLGILSLDGNEITPPEFDLLYRSQEGYAGYMKNDLWGYVSTKGEIIIPPIFPLIWDFKDGLARAVLQRGIGFIDKSRNIVIPPKFIEVRDFFEGRARFQKLK